MSLEFTNSGLSVEEFEEIFQRKTDEYREIYGNDIDLSPNTQDGQRTGIEARQVLDIQAFALAVYNQLDADLSSGDALNRIIKWAGITRRPATRSQVDVEITTDRALTLDEGYRVADDVDQVWETQNEIELVSGVNTVTLFAQDFGEITGLADTITEPVDIIPGVLSVNNPDAALVGRDEETDPELRRRRNRSTENPGRSTTGQLFAALGNLPNVTRLRVYENDTSVQDTERDLTPHQIWCVIEGGAVDEIIETLAKNKSQGTPIKGDVEGTFIETLIKPDGDEFFITHEMKFDRPTYVPLYVRLTATRKESDSPVDDEAITNNLVAREFDINENALASDLYREVYDAGDNFIPTDLEISLDGSTWTDGRLESFFDEIYEIDADNVTITEVIP